MLLALALAVQLTATNADSVAWDYDQVDVDAGAVATFLVCLDGQPTAACATVPVVAGVGLHTYTWKLPALTAGAHRVAVQACTAGAATCSSGVTLAFTVQVVLKNPAGLRLVKGG